MNKKKLFTISGVIVIIAIGAILYFAMNKNILSLMKGAIKQFSNQPAKVILPIDSASEACFVWNMKKIEGYGVLICNGASDEGDYWEIISSPSVNNCSSCKGKINKTNGSIEFNKEQDCIIAKICY